MQYSKKIAKLGKKMILLIIPQKYDLSEFKKKNYKIFFESLSKKINVLDLTSSFENSENINSLYINDNYAGHLSKIGNQLVCREILLYMKDKKI